MLKAVIKRIRQSLQLADGFTLWDVIASVRTKPTPIDSFQVDNDAPSSGLSDLAQLAMQQTGEPFLKWWHYFDIYSLELGGIAERSRNGTLPRPLHLLEIGVWRGGSMGLWREYFGTSALIYGVDIDQRSREFCDNDAEIRIGSQTDSLFMNGVVDEMAYVDIIIDDGSHNCLDVVSTLEMLWPRLADDGVYIIEDLHTSYWPAWGGGLRRRGSSVEALKRLIDEMHRSYFGRDTRVGPLSIPRSELFSVSFYDSVAVLRKKPVPRPKPFRGGKA